MSSVGDISLDGKIVVITGGGSGIHLELAKLAQSEGARVIIADLKLTEEAQLVLNKDVVFQYCDVAEWKQLQELVTVSNNLFGDVPDVYVAGAGVFEPVWSSFWEDTEDESYNSVQINVNHPIKLTRVATKALLKRNKRGVVLIMASIAGYSGHFTSPLYSATKHALVGFTRSIGELDRLGGVKVVTICPGIVKTPLWTADPQRSARFGYSDAISISPESVAKAELSLIKSGAFPGGTVYEISVAGERVVPEWNISPPGYDPDNPTQGVAVPPEALAQAYQPIVDILNKEREQ